MKQAAAALARTAAACFRQICFYDTCDTGMISNIYFLSDTRQPDSILRPKVPDWLFFQE